jgi:hypothetical protein
VCDISRPFYLYRPDSDAFAAVGISTADNARIVNLHFTDVPVANQWNPPIAFGFRGTPDMEGDFPSLVNFYPIPVMSDRAWTALRPLIGYCSEALPIKHYSHRAFVLVHVMDTVDALDEGQSKFKRNAANGQITRIYVYAFRLELLERKHIFKLSQKCGSLLIVDDAFRDRVESNRLRGLEFEELPMAK